jgi:hypothetical protein
MALEADCKADFADGKRCYCFAAEGLQSGNNLTDEGAKVFGTALLIAQKEKEEARVTVWRFSSLAQISIISNNLLFDDFTISMLLY